MDVNWQVVFTVAAALGGPAATVLVGWLVWHTNAITRERDDLREREARRLEAERRADETELSWTDRLLARIGTLEADNDRLRHAASLASDERADYERGQRVYWQNRALATLPVLRESNDIAEAAQPLLEQIAETMPRPPRGP